MSALTIGKLAASAGVNVETVRYYQRIGLLETPATLAGYRQYDDTHVQQLLFIRRAKEAGFSLEEVGALLHLDAIHDRQQIRALAEHRLHDLEERIRGMQALAGRLQALIQQCVEEKTGICCPIVETFRADPA